MPVNIIDKTGQNKRAAKAISAYFIVFILNFATYYSEWHFFDYLIPFLLVILPLIAGSAINFSFSRDHFFNGLSVSLVFLLPYVLFEMYHGRAFVFPGISLLAFQLLAVSVPEEIFFRGFIQENIGNNVKGILITSMMFSLAHLPVFLLDNNAYALLTFFPSIVIGYIYMKTTNIMPCIMFHFLSNSIWVGLR